MMSVSAMHRRYWFTDVHVRGSYPLYMLNYFDKQGFNLDITEDDIDLLQTGCVDYIGFSYYMSFVTKATEDNSDFNYVEPHHLVKKPYIKTSEWGWQIDAIGIRYSLNWFWDRFQLPIFIVENSFGAVDSVESDGMIDDQYRIDYLAAHIREMNKAIFEDGIDLI